MILNRYNSDYIRKVKLENTKKERVCYRPSKEREFLGWKNS
ncbi:hypothetical protein [Bacillus sp. JJ1773]